MRTDSEKMRNRTSKGVGRALLLSIVIAACPLGARESALRQETGGSPDKARSDVARFRGRVETALASGGADQSYWGVLVSDADNGQALYTLNAARFFMPASNAKLFTTVLALSTLGPDFRERTTIETAGTVDSSGQLQGDLVLVGRGDANLSNRVLPYVKRDVRNGPPEKALAELADRVVASGVKRISGDVVADDSYFAAGRFPPGWTIDDTVWSYGAAVSAIAINDNAISLVVRPGAAVAAPLSFQVAPWSGLYEIRNDAATTAARTEAQLRLSRDPESRVIRLSGTVPLDAPARELLPAITEPAENAAMLLMRMLQGRGVAIAGRSRAIHADDTIPKPPPAAARRVLAERLSPPLLEDVRITNKLSLNLHAEMLLRVAAREKAAAMTLDAAGMFADQFRGSIGLTPQDALLFDGSGLSRDDLVTPQSVVQLLAYAQRQPWGRDFAATLPVAGEDGTLENRMKGTAAAGHVQAKTGLVDHVDSLSGYATSKGGEHLIFSFFVNNAGARGRDMMSVLDAICVAMVEELGDTGAAKVTSPGEANGSTTERRSAPASSPRARFQASR